MAAGGVLALRRAARLVEDDLLVAAHGFAHRLREVEAVKVLEALGIDRDDVDAVLVHEMAHHVPERQVRLVAHRDEIGGAHFGILAEAAQQKGPALADDGRTAAGILPIIRHLGGGDEPRVELAGPRDDAHAVCPEEDRAAVAAGGEAGMGFVDACDHAGGHVAAFRGFPEAARDEQHAARGVAFQNFVHERGDLFRAYGHDEQIKGLLEFPEGRHAAHAAFILAAFAQDHQILAVKARIDDVFEDDAPEVAALGGDAHDADGAGVEEVVYLVDGASWRAVAGKREAAHAVQRHHKIIGKGEGVDFQLFDDEGGVRVGGRKMVAHADEGLKAFDELLVGDDAALAASESGQFPVGDGFAEKLEKGVAVGHFRERGDDGLPLAEPGGVELGVRAAEPGADDHAEFAGAAQAHDQLVAEGRGVGRHELDLQDALEIGGDGVLEGRAGKPAVGFRGGGGGTFNPFRIALGDFREHPAHGGAHFFRRLRHDAHAPHLRFVDDGRGDDLEHSLFAGQGHDLLFGGFGVARYENALGRRFGPGKTEQAVDFVFVEEAASLGMGIAEQFGNRLVFDGQIHGISPELAVGPRAMGGPLPF